MSAQVLFRVVCPTQLSQTVIIVGNNSALGNWNPLNGFKLSTSPDTYPVWMNEDALEVEPNEILEFKIVISDGINFQWEIGANRLIQILSQKMVVILTFDQQPLIIHNIRRLFSNTDLTNITESNARKISIQLQEKLYDSDEDSDQELESDENSQFYDEETSLISNEQYQCSPNKQSNTQDCQLQFGFLDP
ncbi:unnamed protein product (macronuclear) [Paramecium tetraurelia]|uniref:CBM20 domain-containing protein n=1 Tax=Paramecium tetraurelia TaxID=5888 RepID=A0CGS3_PARTE|nr:uncharacterized protein GSPATT00007430001 [Paramecium tetraurelia]CAK69990.1 unnamed protein product [Paramecium tetraurelia]|eukprot:XP_001437387.1 hypothetical protein (macronuclear) [Paramecium tetraurelia strain d4-2]